jgi:hypothetical protein
MYQNCFKYEAAKASIQALIASQDIMSNSPFLVKYSWLCRVRNLHFLIPGYVFLTMSFEKSPIAHSWLCIPGYVAHGISNNVSCLCRVRILVNQFLECENPYTRFLAMYSWLCHVENRTLSTLSSYKGP